MNNTDFEHWCEQNKVSERGKAMIQKIRNSPPARNVGSGRSNVPGRYASRKMGVTIQWESHTLELAAIFLMEHDPDVLEFYDQPSPKIKLEYVAKGGNSASFLHTADFFVIRTNGARWEEWKKLSDMPALAVKMPNRYVQDAAGHWLCPPGQKFAEDYGLTYTVQTSDLVNPILIRNIDFLEDYMNDKNGDVTNDIKLKIKDIIQKNPGVTLQKVLSVAPYPDDIYRMLSQNIIFVDVQQYVLAESEYCPVYSDKITAEAFTKARHVAEIATQQRFTSEVRLEVKRSMNAPKSFEEVKEIVDLVVGKNIPMSRKQFCRMYGYSIKRYPELHDAIGRAHDLNRQQTFETKVQKIRDAVVYLNDHGQFPTIKKITNITGINFDARYRKARNEILFELCIKA